MGQETKDETRWLARLLSIIPVTLGIKGIFTLVQRVLEEPFSILMIIGFVVSVFLLWLGYQLLTCSSLWNMFSWMPATPPLFLYFQCQYFRINKHIRSGLVAGMILLIVHVLVYFMRVLYNDFQLSKWIVRISQRIFWPPRDWIEILNFSQWPPLAQVLFVVFYIFAIGFLIGVSISYITGRVMRKRFNQTLSELNNDSSEQ